VSWRGDTGRDGTERLVDRYHPKTFEKVVGQPDTVAGLVRQVRSERPRSLLLTGPTGTGKTTVAGIVARALLCERITESGSPCLACSNCISFADGNPLNYEKYNCALSNFGVSELTGMLESSRANRLGGRVRVYFLDEAHNLSQKAFDSLLGVLDTPRHRVFILASTQADRIPKPVRNRLTHYKLKLLRP